jgi:hypothetical protein
VVHRVVLQQVFRHERSFARKRLSATQRSS